MKKANVVFAIGLISAIIATILSVSAAILYDSANVSYTNTTSGLSATKVQNAIDELNTKSTNYSSLDTRVAVYENGVYPANNTINHFNNARKPGLTYSLPSNDYTNGPPLKNYTYLVWVHSNAGGDNAYNKTQLAVSLSDSLLRLYARSSDKDGNWGSWKLIKALN